MEAGVDLLHIGLLHGLHHQDGHLLRGGVLLGLLAADSEGTGTVAHDEILPIVRLMVEAVSGSMRGTFSDNMISVRPSAEKNIVFMTEEEADLDRFRENMRIMDLYTAMC